MVADKRKIAADCWKRGSEAMAKEHWDYAIEMFSKSVSLVPDNLMYRQTLRGVEYRKYDNNKSGARMSKMKLMGVRGRIKKAKMKQDWTTVDREAEAGLQVNPWDVQLNADMAKACRELGFDEVAVFGYQKALEGDMDNKEYNRALAELLEERGDYTGAVKCWERIQKVDPLDGAARSKITQLQASSVMDRGGYEGAGTTRDVKTAYDHDMVSRRQAKQPEGVDGPGMSVEADLQRAIRKDPSSSENYLKLADHYKREGQLEEAAETYQQALEVSGGDHNVREQLEDVELLQMRKNLDMARGAASEDGDEKSKKRASALAKELLQREIEVFSSRVERYPNDMRLKYELGQRFMRIKKYQQAIPLLQAASRDSRLQADVLVSLGKCFIADKKNGLAKRQFEKALPDLNHHDKPELYKEAQYLMGRLCEESNERDSAEDHYNEVLAVDYEYKDTLKRLEKLQSGGSEKEAS